MHAERLIEVVLCNNLLLLSRKKREICSIERDLAMAGERQRHAKK